MKLLKNDKGQGIIAMALILLLVAGAGVVSLMSEGDLMVLTAKDEKKQLIARQDFNRLFALGSYLVSNNFILCKQSGWEGLDVAPNGCIFQGERNEIVNGNVTTVSADTFGLNQLERTSPEAPLSFELDMEKFRQGRSVKTQEVTVSATISFELVDTYQNELYEQLAGKIDDSERSVNMDHYMILQSVTITLDALGNRENIEKITRKVGIRRPISIPKLVTRGSACAAECLPALSEGAHVSCRGPQTIDTQAESEVQITIKNLGPGVLYDLAYQKDVSYTNGSPRERSGKFDAINDKNFIFPDVAVDAVDSVNCLRFVETTNNPADNGKIEQHSVVAGAVNYNINIDNVAANKGKGNYIDRQEVYLNPVKYLFEGLVPTAHAQADGLNMDPCSGGSDQPIECQNVSMLEPFRGVVNQVTGEFQGYTESIYVAPSH